MSHAQAAIERFLPTREIPSARKNLWKATRQTSGARKNLSPATGKTHNRKKTFSWPPEKSPVPEETFGKPPDKLRVAEKTFPRPAGKVVARSRLRKQAEPASPRTISLPDTLPRHLPTRHRSILVIRHSSCATPQSFLPQFQPLTRPHPHALFLPRKKGLSHHRQLR